MRVAIPASESALFALSSSCDFSSPLIENAPLPEELVSSMLDCLADQVRHDEHLQISNTVRYMWWYGVVSVLVCFAIYFNIQWLQ